MKLTIPEQEVMQPGHLACQGCGATMAMRYALKVFGRDTMLTIPACCWAVIDGPFPYTAVNVPLFHTAFETAAVMASGIKAGLDAQGKTSTNVVAWAGDGGTFDIGIAAISGAAERNDDILYVCYDNEAYMNCLSLDSLIMTKNGLKKITEVKLGEEVYAFNQKTGELTLKKCTGIFDNGIKKVFEVNTLHHTIKATSNHPFLVLKRSGRGKKSYFVWKELKDLMEDNEIVVLKKLMPGKSFKFNPIKLSKKGDYKVNKINEIEIPKVSSENLMELLGLYVGDGWVRPQKAEVGFALPKNSKGSKRLIYLYEKVFNQNLIQKDEFYIYIYSVNLAKFIDSLGFGKGAKNKIVPEWVFTLPEYEKEAFVRGLMLSDGYKFKNSHRYVSASQDLLRTLRLLLQTIGYQVGKIHKQTKKKGTLCVYRQLLEDSTYGYICFSKKKKPDISKYLSQVKQRDFLADNEYFSTEKVTSIKFVKEEPTLDLRVEGEHNFIADGIVVHNTGIQRSSATPRGAWTTTTPIKHYKKSPKKNMVEIIAAHRVPYTSTASVGYPEDFIKKLKKAKEIRGFKLIHVLAPCPTGWKADPKYTVKLAKLAVQTNIFPIYEVEDGIKYTQNIKVKQRKPITEYFKYQGRFKHLKDDEIAFIQKKIDEDYEILLKKLS